MYTHIYIYIYIYIYTIHYIILQFTYKRACRRGLVAARTARRVPRAAARVRKDTIFYNYYIHYHVIRSIFYYSKL